MTSTLEKSSRSSQQLASRPINEQTDDDCHHQLAQQIKHNLQYQHGWTHLRIHTTSPTMSGRLARPIISGLPPRRLYVHPDEQIDFIKNSRKNKTSNPSEIDDFQPEFEWVLPAHLRQEWTLRDFACLFDVIDVLPPDFGPAQQQPEGIAAAADNDNDDDDDAAATAATANDTGKLLKISPRWSTTKRALLAILQDDSTIVYYFIHDGLVKPRQN